MNKLLSIWLTVFIVSVASLSALESKGPSSSGVRALSFGSPADNPPEGFIRVTTNVFAEDLGYGWLQQGVTALSRTPEAKDPSWKKTLSYSLHEGKGTNIFRIRVPEGKFRCFLLTGDLGFPAPAFSLAVNNTIRIQAADTVNYIPCVQTWLFNAEPQNGFIDFEFNGAPAFTICGLVLAPQSAWDVQAAPIVKRIEKELALGPADFLQNWKEKKHPPAEMFIPTEEEKRSGLVCFEADKPGTVYPATVPLRSEVQTRFWAFAAPGEYEPVVFGVYPVKKDVLIKSVRLTDMESSGREKLPAECMTFRVARYRAHRTQWIKKNEYEVVPELLEKAHVPLPLDETKLFWITVKVPERQPPGIYRGEVLLETSGPVPVTINVTMTVLPISLPADPARVFGIYYLNPLYNLNYPARKKQYEERGLVERMTELRARDFRDMREHGITTIDVISLYSHVLKKDGQIIYELPEEFIEAARQAGVLKNPMFGCTPNLNDICNITGDPKPPNKSSQEIMPPLSEEFKRVYVDGIRFFQAKAKEKGWPEPLFYAVDEPSPKVLKDYGKRLCRLVHEVPGARTFITGRVADYYLDNEFIKLIDVISYSDADSVPEDKSVCRGHWFYPNNITGSCGNGSYTRFVAGLGFWFSGLEGCAPWRYLAQGDSLDNDLDGNMTDFFMSYPTAEEHMPTVRWECWREGVDDCRYQTLLDTMLQKAKGSGKTDAIKVAEEIEKEREQIAGKIPTLKQFATGVASAAEFTGQTTDKSFNRANWVCAYADRIRWITATQIMKLAQVLGEKYTPPGMAISANKNSLALKFKRFWRSFEKKYFQAREPDSRTESPISLQVISRVRNMPEPGMIEEVLGSVRARDVIIDGELNEDCWKAARKVNLILRDDQAAPQERTEAMVANDDEYLYVGFRCYDREMRLITAKSAQRDDPVWDDDCVEVFVGEKVGCRDYYQFAVNANGMVADGLGSALGNLDIKWNADLAVGVKKLADSWQAELKIPLKAMILHDPINLGINLCREEKRIGENSCWHSTGKGFGETRDFGRLRLNGPECCLSKITLGQPVLGRNVVAAEIWNAGMEDKVLQGAVALEGKEANTARQWKSDEILIKSRTGITTNLMFELVEPGVLPLRVSLYEKERLLDKRVLKVDSSAILNIIPSSYFIIRGVDLINLKCDIKISPALKSDSTLQVLLQQSETGQTVFTRDLTLNEVPDLNFILQLGPIDLKPGPYRAVLTLKAGTDYKFTNTTDFQVVDGAQDCFP